MSDRALANGHLVAEGYTIVETLEETETGFRYLADQDGERVEVIEYFPEYATRKKGATCVAEALRQQFRDGLAAFRRLGEFLRDYRHDSIVAVHDVRNLDGTCYFFADWVTGTNFCEALEKKLFPSLEGWESPSRWDLEALLQQLLAGLAAVHGKGLVHGNISAKNVVLRPNSATPVLVGFGMGPYRYGGHAAVGSWTDIRAVGEVATEALRCGQPDSGLNDEKPDPRPPKAGSRLEEAVAAAVDAGPERGPQDAAAVLELLRGRRSSVRMRLIAAAFGGLLAAAAIVHLSGEGIPRALVPGQDIPREPYSRPGNGVEMPRPLREVAPRYTSDALRAKVQGVVLVEAVVLPDGSVGDVTVVRSLDRVFGLDEEAIKAARQWRFLPGTRFGKPVAALVTIELSFAWR